MYYDKIYKPRVDIICPQTIKLYILYYSTYYSHVVGLLRGHTTVADKKNSHTRNENDRTVPFSTSVVRRTRAYTVPYVHTTYGVLVLVRTYVRTYVGAFPVVCIRTYVRACSSTRGGGRGTA